MTNNLQALYDILGEAFKAGQAYVQSECEERDISASWYLSPLDARMEAEIAKLHSWQPIETAPQDGSRILGVRQVTMSHPPPGHGKVFMLHWNQESDQWYTDTGFLVHPSHWMPLPSSPERET